MKAFRFQPASFSWVAMHPNPKGVVQFIGGAFFGSLPTIFYRYLLRKIFEAGYTIVALPFRFTFRHWPVAISLLREQAVLENELPLIAKRLNYQYDIYYDKKKYFWLGHSLGCKYITLLEFFSGDNWKKILQDCAQEDSQGQLKRIAESIANIPDKHRDIKGQPSLLLAPDISDTDSAVPQPLAALLDRFKLGVMPTRQQTQCFVNESNLFNLSALISFDNDKIAGNATNPKNDVFWFIQQLQQRKFPLLHQELPNNVPDRHCKHLEPLGSQIGNYIVDLNPFDKFIAPLKHRQLESFVILFLEKLQRREEELS